MAGGPGGGGDAKPLTTAELAIRLGLAFVLLLLAQTFTGLNLGLFALDCGQLQVIIDVPKQFEATDKAKRDAWYARRVLPLRRLGNLLLCTILLGNTMVNAMMAILLAGLTSGFMGWLITTVLIVYIGEILPQSVCSKHGLKFGAIGSPIIWVFVIALFPITKLYAIVLDWLFPDEESLMDRSGWRGMVEYMQYVKPDSMPVDQTKMLLSSLDLGVTQVHDVMVPLRNACYLEVDDVLNLEKLMWIQQTRFTRLPVYDQSKRRFVGIVHCRDLLRRDFHRGVTLRVSELLDTLIKNGLTLELTQISASSSMLDLMSLFKQGKSHLIVVSASDSRRSWSKETCTSMKSTASCDTIVEGKRDSEVEASEPHIGLVTLHDVHHCILDSGAIQDPSSPRPTCRISHTWKGATDLFTHPMNSDKQTGILPDDQLQAIQVLLKQTQPCFSGAHISDADLWELLKKTEVAVASKGEELYRSNERSQIAVLVLRGQVEVSAGKDGFVSRVGHLAALGMQALEPPLSRLPALRTSGSTELLEHHDVHEYIPDFTATVVSNECCLIRIPRHMYLQGFGSTQLHLARAELTLPGAAPPSVQSG